MPVSTPGKNVVSPTQERFAELFQDALRVLPGAHLEPVRAQREMALAAFLARGLPTRRIEEWKYTDLNALMPAPKALAASAPAALPDLDGVLSPALRDLDAHTAVFVDGFYTPALSDLEGAPGLAFEPLARGLAGEETGQILARLATDRGGPIAELATAFATDGALVSIAAGARLQKPLHLVFIATDPAFTAYQNVVTVGEGAVATLLETHIGAEEAQTVHLNRIDVGVRAGLTHIRFSPGASGMHLASLEARLAAAARYDLQLVSLDGALNRTEAAIRFEGAGGRCHFTGAMAGRSRTHTDFTLLVDHAMEGCESRELVKAVLDERARGVFQGKVIVRRGAQKTDGKQMANALLLSDDAEFDSKPELEIYADDVVCGHGATAGQIDEDLLFYLRSRGLLLQEARAMLIAAFLGEALEKIEHEAIREAMEADVAGWLSRSS